MGTEKKEKQDRSLLGDVKLQDTEAEKKTAGNVLKGAWANVSKCVRGCTTSISNFFIGKKNELKEWFGAWNKWRKDIAEGKNRAAEQYSTDKTQSTANIAEAKGLENRSTALADVDYKGSIHVRNFFETLKKAVSSKEEFKRFIGAVKETYNLRTQQKSAYEPHKAHIELAEKGAKTDRQKAYTERMSTVRSEADAARKNYKGRAQELRGDGNKEDHESTVKHKR